jgi:hypothetical protein
MLLDRSTAYNLLINLSHLTNFHWTIFSTNHMDIGMLYFVSGADQG